MAARPKRLGSGPIATGLHCPCSVVLEKFVCRRYVTPAWPAIAGAPRRRFAVRQACGTTAGFLARTNARHMRAKSRTEISRGQDGRSAASGRVQGLRRAAVPCRPSRRRWTKKPDRGSSPKQLITQTISPKHWRTKQLLTQTFHPNTGAPNS
jgi:hypothetical protein